MRAGSAVNVEHLAAMARRRLPWVAADYLFGGAEDELTLARNRAAFAAVAFRQRVLPGVAAPSTTVRLFGRDRPLPFLVGPTGLNGLFWHRGDTALARAAGRAGAIFTCSTASNETLEEIAAASSGTCWFQLYPLRDRAATGRLVARAKSAGYEVLVVTIDALVPGKRERDLRNDFAHDIRIGPKRILDGFLHARWLASPFLRGGLPRMANLREFLPPGASAHVAAQFMRSNRDPSFSWDDARAIRDAWSGPVLLKGVMSVEDARLAKRHGFDGVVVSNHGGRQLDGAPSALAALAEIVAEGGADLPLLIDGGFRRGSDIVKALCLGASAVLLGRATLFGLAAGGEEGVDRAIAILRDEMMRTMALLGCASVSELGPRFVRPAEATADLFSRAPDRQWTASTTPTG